MAGQEKEPEPEQTTLGQLWNFGRNSILAAADTLTPTLKTSYFQTKGYITPQEFLDAGDLLVLRCPTWAWAAGDKAKAKNYLPPNKQFLVTRNVPCQKRVRHLLDGADQELLVNATENDDEQWVATHANHVAQKIEDIPDMVQDFPETKPVQPEASSGASDLDLGNLNLGDEEEDPSSMPPSTNAHILRTRTYDLSITYDNYYRCARVWLYGYSEDRQPLTQAQVLEDISADHALKTVTLESHPHIADGAGLHASLHPCQHASVMLKLCQELANSGRECRPDQYLFLFLKFISSVIPTIEYDYTISVE